MEFGPFYSKGKAIGRNTKKLQECWSRGHGPPVEEETLQQYRFKIRGFTKSVPGCSMAERTSRHDCPERSNWQRKRGAAHVNLLVHALHSVYHLGHAVNSY